jgi:branched-chain amino acid transport system substrate-binding protein
MGTACLAVAAALGGCAKATTTGSTVTGSTLSIYARDAGDATSRDVIGAEQLAYQQAGQQVGHFKIAFHVLTNGKISADARTAITDSRTIAYLGELTPHQSADSIGITSAQGILQVSPTDTALELTKATAAVKGAPDVYYQSLSTYHRTFGRVVPTSDKEAQVLVKVMGMGQQPVRKLYVIDDGSAYGKAIALALTADAKAAGIATVSSGGQRPDAAKIKASGADAMFAGADVGGLPATARLFDALSAIGPRIRLFGPSPLDAGAFAASLSVAAQRVTTVSAPGFRDSDLNQAGRNFVAKFKAAYNRRPGPSAIFGYEAMASVLDALRRAGTAAGSRTDVVKAFFDTKDRSSVLGTYSIDPATGDVQGIAPYVISRIRAGALVPYDFIQG